MRFAEQSTDAQAVQVLRPLRNEQVYGLVYTKQAATWLQVLDA